MSEHYISATMPERQIEKSPLVIKVWSDGVKLGELHVSQGGVMWWPAKSKTEGAWTSWEQVPKRLTAE